MFKRTLLFLLIAACFAPVLHAKSPPKKPAGKSSAQELAAFMPKVKAAMAARWGDAVAARRAEFSAGNVIVTFALDADGKVTEFTVTANTSNEVFAKFCEEFVRGTKFAAPPAGALTGGRIEIPFNFTIL